MLNLNIRKALDNFLPVMTTSFLAGYCLGIRMKECNNNPELDHNCELFSIGSYLFTAGTLATGLVYTWKHFIKTHHLQERSIFNKIQHVFLNNSPATNSKEKHLSTLGFCQGLGKILLSSASLGVVAGVYIAKNTLQEQDNYHFIKISCVALSLCSLATANTLASKV